MLGAARSNRAEGTLPVALGATALCTAGLLGPIPRMGSDGRWGNWQTRPTLDRDTFQVRSLGGQLHNLPP